MACGCGNGCSSGTCRYERSAIERVARVLPNAMPEACGTPPAAPACGGGDVFTRVTPRLLGGSLVQRLVPLIDRSRDLRARFGLRSYALRQVRTRWTGGTRGRGEEVVVSEIDILPVPWIIDLSTLQQVAQPVGPQEVGDLQVQEVSLAYTEEELRGLGRNGEALPPDSEFWYELEFVNTSRPDGIKRRFQLRSVPSQDRENVQWTLTLVRAQGDRRRNGDVR